MPDITAESTRRRRGRASDCAARAQKDAKAQCKAAPVTAREDSLYLALIEARWLDDSNFAKGPKAFSTELRRRFAVGAAGCVVSTGTWALLASNIRRLS